MLTVTQLFDGRLSIKADYFYRQRIKSIPTAVFDANRKEWIIENFMLGLLEQRFDGELVYKTPRWVILNEPAPDMSKMYQIKHQIQAPTLTKKLYDYQDFGVRFMIDKVLIHNFVINADDVGLGKTIQTIGTIKWFYENKGIRKVLIVCKKSIKKQWVDELNKFTGWDTSEPQRKIIYTGSTAAQRKKAYAVINQSQEGILITNYHTFLNDAAMLSGMGFDFVVVDEAHVVKARTGKLNNNIAMVSRGKPTVFLTGTPVMSRPEDIFGIIQIANPKYFGPYLEFKKKYLVVDTNGRYGAHVVGAKNLDELRAKVQDVVIRRTEYEVSVQLPSIVLQTKECDMDKTQEAILVAIQEKQDEIGNALLKLKEQEKQPFADIVAINKKRDVLDVSSKSLIAARQAASTDPRMFLRSNSKLMRDTYGVMVPANYKMSPKTETMLETIEDILDNGDKVILFTKFRTCAEMAAHDIQASLKYHALLYTGGETEQQRDKAVDLFKNSASFNVLIGTEAMAEGLNLQCAKYIVNIDQPDTFAIKTQRIGRARRVGSAFTNVTVYDLITSDSGNTKSKDVERLANIEKNRDLTDALVNIDEAQREALIAAMKG